MATSAGGLTIRRARPEEAEALSELAAWSKAVWGYDEAFLEEARQLLRITPEYVARAEVHVAEDGGRLVGFYGLERAGGAEAEVGFLFVDPDALGTGVGRALWDHAVGTARALGLTSFLIEADPHAEGFYRTMGAEWIGTRPTGVGGRPLPLFRFSIGEGGRR
ncbi:MAG TPA: GNAT family N-acetyltransferase [Actinomycetota bacterium]|nr:GNAT family N-acetyltransferase [Actinomycetota bacterium]